MNHDTARCGHSIAAVGAPNSQARMDATAALCEDCLLCYREGCDANDHNHRVYRNQRGTTKGNPYEVNSQKWKAWRDGYAYRDMVNDG